MVVHRLCTRFSGIAGSLYPTEHLHHTFQCYVQKLALREQAFKSVPAVPLQVMCPGYVLSLALGPYCQVLGSHQEQWQAGIVFRVSWTL